MRTQFCFFSFLAILGLMQGLAATPEQALFDGKTLSGWRFFSPQGGDINACCSIEPEGILRISGKPVGYLATVEEYENYTLTLEWRWLAPKGNSGVLIHMNGPDKLWPTCMQLQTKVGSAGEWIPMSDFVCAEPLAPGAKSLPRKSGNPEKPVGEWNKAEIVCKGDRIECSINGILVNTASRCSSVKGAIGIQLEGAPYELRKIILRNN